MFEGYEIEFRGAKSQLKNIFSEHLFFTEYKNFLSARISRAQKKSGAKMRNVS